jgi:hypothetical protein
MENQSSEDITCSGCMKEFTSSKGLKIHQKRRPNCNVDLICKICEKEFSSRWELERHMNRKTSCKPIIETENSHYRIACSDCNRTFKTNKTLTYHVKTCKGKEINKHRIVILEQEKEELKRQLLVGGNTTTINNITTNNNNNNIQVIQINTIQDIRPFGQENLSYIDQDQIARYLSDPDRTPGEAYAYLVEKIHFNAEHPENHNIYLCDKEEFIILNELRQWGGIAQNHVVRECLIHMQKVFSDVVVSKLWVNDDEDRTEAENYLLTKVIPAITVDYGERKHGVLPKIRDLIKAKSKMIQLSHNRLPKKQRPAIIFKTLHKEHASEDDQLLFDDDYRIKHTDEPIKEIDIPPFEEDDFMTSWDIENNPEYNDTKFLKNYSHLLTNEDLDKIKHMVSAEHDSNLNLYIKYKIDMIKEKMKSELNESELKLKSELNESELNESELNESELESKT